MFIELKIRLGLNNKMAGKYAMSNYAYLILLYYINYRRKLSNLILPMVYYFEATFCGM